MNIVKQITNSNTLYIVSHWSGYYYAKNINELKTLIGRLNK
jgi:hypothetical protein